MSQLLWQGKEQPWAGRPASRLLSPLPARAHSAAGVPQRKVNSSSGMGKEEPKRRPGRLSTKSIAAKVETKPKKATGKDESSDRKVQAKGQRGAKGKPWKWPPKRLKIYLHQMERLKTRIAQPLTEQERKKVPVIKITHPSRSVVPAYLLYNTKESFHQFFCKSKVF